MIVTEHRRTQRKRADIMIQVTNAVTGEIMGRIGNLSADGMMLIANRALRDDALYQLVFHLPNDHGQTQTVEVGAHEQWSEPASAPGQYWTGFRFIDISEADAATLGKWISEGAVTD